MYDRTHRDGRANSLRPSIRDLSINDCIDGLEDAHRGGGGAAGRVRSFIARRAPPLCTVGKTHSVVRQRKALRRMIFVSMEILLISILTRRTPFGRDVGGADETGLNRPCENRAVRWTGRSRWLAEHTLPRGRSNMATSLSMSETRADE
jgi:hypothetical protein